MAAGDDQPLEPAPRLGLWAEMRTLEDWWAIWCAALLLVLSVAAVILTLPGDFASGESLEVSNPLSAWLDKPTEWSNNPLSSLYRPASGEASAVTPAARNQR